MFSVKANFNFKKLGGHFRLTHVKAFFNRQAGM